MDQWDGSMMPSQQGRIAIVTGANQGIGYECARQLAEHGAHVILACRNEQLARNAVQSLRTHLLPFGSSAGHVEYMLVDIGCMASVKSFAEAVHVKCERLDLLINNAGVGVPLETKCADGYAIQFGVNHLGHFYLTTLLFDLLKKSPTARVVNVSSPAHRQEASAWMCKSTRLDFNQLPSGKGDIGWTRYEKSKLCNLIFTFELDRRLKAANIRNVQSIGTQPGVCATNIFAQWVNNFYPSFMCDTVNTMCSYAMQSAYMGSLPLLYGATEADVKSGEFFGPSGRKHWFGFPTREIPAPACLSEEYGQELWELSEKLTKTRFAVE